MEHIELEELLLELPARERAAIALRFGLAGGEHTYSEIAEELGYSHRESARLAVCRGLARLRSLLRRYEILSS